MPNELSSSSFDQILKLAGGFGRFQIRQLIILSLSYASNGFMDWLPMIVFRIPDLSLSSEDKFQTQNQTITEVMINATEESTTRDLCSTKNYIINDPVIKNNFITDLNLVCTADATYLEEKCIFTDNLGAIVSSS